MPLAPDEFVLDQPKGGEEFTLDMPKRRTPLESLARGWGLINRGSIEGAASIPLMIADAPRTVQRSLGYQTPPTLQERLSSGLTKAGFPEPQGAQEHIVSFLSGAAIPTEASVRLTDIARPGAKFISDAMQKEARSLMQSSLKPTLEQLRKGDAAIAIDTMLEKGIPSGEKGVRMLRDQIDRLNEQIGEAISSSGEKVSKSAAIKNLQELLKKFERQVNPQADMEAVKNAWVQFRDHPLLRGSDEIPVQLAQQLKQGTYKQLSGKYGEMGSAETEAQKAIARSMKEQIAEKVPQVAGLNAEESKLIRTLGVAERRALMDLNKNPVGLSLLAHNPKAAIAFMADRSAMFKNLAARMIYRASGPAGEIGKRAAGVGLYELSREKRIEDIPQ